MKNLYYLAVPYHGTEAEMQHRKQLSLQTTVALLQDGAHAFAPNIYVNQIAAAMDFESIEQRRSTIMPYLLDFLAVSKAMIIVTAEGWQQSYGVGQEIAYCRQHKIPMYTLSPDAISKDADVMGSLQEFLGEDFSETGKDKWI